MSSLSIPPDSPATNFLNYPSLIRKFIDCIAAHLLVDREVYFQQTRPFIPSFMADLYV